MSNAGGIGKVNDLDINPRIVAALRKAKLVDFGSILSLSAADLERTTRLTASDIVVLQSAVAAAVPRLPMVTALQLYTRDVESKDLLRSRLSTGCSTLDAFLRGGVLTRALTEVVGESGSGKTQICLQLSLTVQLPLDLGGLQSGAVYVCTEDVFPDKRLVEMVSRLKSRCPVTTGHSFTDHIYIEHATDLDDLGLCLARKLPALLAGGRVRLVVLDSIAALFRCQQTDPFQRAKQLSSLAGSLLHLAVQYDAAVVVVNQVSDVFADKASVNAGLRCSGQNNKVPTLGLCWSNMLTVRLMLSRTHDAVTIHRDSREPGSVSQDGKEPGTMCRHNGVPGTYEANIRRMEVLLAPHLANSVCLFIIDEDGVKGYA